MKIFKSGQISLNKVNDIGLATKYTARLIGNKSKTMISFKSLTQTNISLYGNKTPLSISSKTTASQTSSKNCDCSLKTQPDIQEPIIVINECIDLLKEIELNAQHSKVTISVSEKEKMKKIRSLINNLYIERSKNPCKIQSLTKQLILEKREKIQAIQTSQNLIKQQQQQIEQLKLRISRYQ